MESSPESVCERAGGFSLLRWITSLKRTPPSSFGDGADSTHSFHKAKGATTTSTNEVIEEHLQKLQKVTPSPSIRGEVDGDLSRTEDKTVVYLRSRVEIATPPPSSNGEAEESESLCEGETRRTHIPIGHTLPSSYEYAPFARQVSCFPAEALPSAQRTRPITAFALLGRDGAAPAETPYPKIYVDYKSHYGFLSSVKGEPMVNRVTSPVTTVSPDSVSIDLSPKNIRPPLGGRVDSTLRRLGGQTVIQHDFPQSGVILTGNVLQRYSCQLSDQWGGQVGDFNRADNYNYSSLYTPWGDQCEGKEKSTAIEKNGIDPQVELEKKKLEDYIHSENPPKQRLQGYRCGLKKIQEHLTQMKKPATAKVWDEEFKCYVIPDPFQKVDKMEKEPVVAKGVAVPEERRITSQKKPKKKPARRAPLPVAQKDAGVTDNEPVAAKKVHLKAELEKVVTLDNTSVKDITPKPPKPQEPESWKSALKKVISGKASDMEAVIDSDDESDGWDERCYIESARKRLAAH